MKKHTIYLLLVLFLSLTSCGDDDPEITQDQRELIMGDEETTTVLGLNAPLVLDRDDIHTTPRTFDLNSDGEDDITLFAFQEFNGDKGLHVTTLNTNTRIAFDDNDNVKPLNEGDVVTIESESWKFADEAPLAVSQGGVFGVWNGLQNRFMAVRIDVNNNRFLAWVELSVDDFDNYSFFNFAFKRVP